jgi:hypothetical protein
MRRSFWQTWTAIQQQDPPELVENLMMVAFIALLGIWLFDQREPYLLAGFSLTVGVYSSMLVRTSLRPNPRFRLTRQYAALGLLITLWGIFQIAR